jgi:hypothetical protein
MTVAYESLIRALETESYLQLRATLEHSSAHDIVETALLIGPLRTLELAYRSDPQFAFRPAMSSPLLSAISAPGPMFASPPDPMSVTMRIMATSVYHEIMPLIGAPPTALAQHEVVALQPQISHAMAASEHVRITRDVTRTLPVPGSPPRLTDGDYAAVAQRHNVDVAAVKAIAAQESRGEGFDANNRPKILFEGHQFRKHSKHLFDRTHPHLSMVYGHQRVFYRWQQYPHLCEALLLDHVAACKAASWGKFQVMGFNHSGWPDVLSFVTAMYESEANHLKSFEAYCSERHIWNAMRRKDWSAVAKAYNGSDAGANDYARSVAGHYAAAGGR